MTLPDAFLDRLALHNRHAWTAAVVSLLGAWVAWVVLYGFGVGLTLGLMTIVQGQEVILGEKLLRIPWWLNASFAGLALALILWAAWDQARHRFAPVDDRPVIGWHIAKDLFLAPARLTLAVATHISGVIRLSHDEREEAFQLLSYIFENGRTPITSLGAHFSTGKRQFRILSALQLAGWVDYHRSSDGDGFYLVRSDEADEVRAMISPVTTET